jgi:hypothetical protein
MTNERQWAAGHCVNRLGRLTALPIDTRIPVMTSWDLGLNDTTSQHLPLTQ